MRYLIRRLARSVGLGQVHHHCRDTEDVGKHLRALGFFPRTFIDVGVAHGTYELYDLWPDARLLLIEPVREFEPSLKWICQHRQSADYRLVAAGESDGEITISGVGRMVGEVGLPLVNDEVRRVPMRRLDGLIDEMGGEPPFLLKVDVQGAEASVLAGAGATIGQSEVILLEAAMYPYGGNPTIVELVNLMKDFDYVPYDFYEGLLRPLDRALGQIDVAFVKANGSFRQSMCWGVTPDTIERKIITKLRRFLGV
ncbi:MAG: FkbM family methyltransferase [Methylocystis silviterrae]